MKTVQVVEYKTDKVVHEIDVAEKSTRMIDKIDSGLNINLNHDLYYTRIKE